MDDRFAHLGGGMQTTRKCNKTTHIECTPETKYFNFFFTLKNDSFNQKRDELETLDELENPKSKVKQVTLLEKLGNQGFHYDIKEIFEPITNAVSDGNQKSLEETNIKANAIMELDGSN